MGRSQGTGFGTAPHCADLRSAQFKQHFLYFLPLPHGQGSLRPTRGSLRRMGSMSISSSIIRACQYACIALALGAIACWRSTTSSLEPSCPGQSASSVNANIARSGSVTSLPPLDGPILRTLLRLAAPNVLATSAAVLVGLAETFYVGQLGIVPLAALGLVFPFAMLTGMLSAGAMGGGVASALARALGAGDAARAQSVALHALLIGACGGVLYSLLFLALAPGLFSLLGGRGAVLREALAYATVLFGGALAVWLFNTLASILRGSGNMRVPSLALCGAALLQVALGAALGLGFGPLPRLGMPGVGLALILAQSSGALGLLWYLRSGRGRVRLVFGGLPIRRELFADILRVGAVACLSPLQSVATMVLLAGFVAQLGVLPLAGFAIGQRLEFLMTTVAFGVGLASVPMVGMAVGAGNVKRARRVAWTAVMARRIWRVPAWS